MRTFLALTLGLLVWHGEVRAGEETPTLARVGTLGDPPPAKSRLVVDVLADGTIRVENTELTLQRLRKFALPLAARVAGKKPVAGISRLHVVFRADRRLPWQAAQWLMTIAAEARVYQLHWAVLPEKGDREGTMALFLPVDRPGPVLEEPPERLRLTAKVWPGKAHADLGSLYARLRAARTREKDKKAHFRVVAGPGVPLGFCLQVCDVAFRAGVKSVEFGGVSIPGAKADLKALVRKLRSNPKWNEPLAIRLNGTAVGSGEGSRITLPAAKRVKDGFAGFAPKHGFDPLELEIEEEPPVEPEEPPEEIVEEPIETEEVKDHDADESEDPDAPFEEDGLSDPPFTGPTKPVDPADKRDRERRRRFAAHIQKNQHIAPALAWLARQQKENGAWLAPVMEGAGGDRMAESIQDTAWAVLTFLGAEYTDRGSRRDNPYAKTVRQGLRFLMTAQDEKGCFGARTGRSYLYGHAVATIALCEAYSMTRNPRYRKPAQTGLYFLARNRNPYLAWGHPPKTGKGDDVTLSALCLFAFRSGKLAGLNVDPDAFEGVRVLLDKRTDKERGTIAYGERDGPLHLPKEALRGFVPRHSKTLTAVGLTCRVFSGEYAETKALMRKAAEHCVLRAPPVKFDEASADPFALWASTLALFFHGGDPWKRWKEWIVWIQKHQRPKAAGEHAGSWDPSGPWGREGGRVRMTALLTICLEIWHRWDRVR